MVRHEGQVCQGEIRNEHEVLKRKYERRRRLGRPRWENNNTE
jgi:hypothetical protein